MTTNLQASVEYLRAYDPNKDGVSFDFLMHMANGTRAYLTECDSTPLTIEDVERMLGKERRRDTSSRDEVYFDRFGFRFVPNGHCEVCCYDDGYARYVLSIYTHGEFRTFCRLFRIEVKA